MQLGANTSRNAGYIAGNVLFAFRTYIDSLKLTVWINSSFWDFDGSGFEVKLLHGQFHESSTPFDESE
jgi:hypothetical protein